jgi:hypothetical protein
MSGEWSDDPANWGRAFGTTKPDEVVVRHSRYWRSPHWTLEYEYFFEVERNAGLAKQAFGGNDLVRVEGEDAVRVRDDAFRERPPWFAPRPAERYEVWILRDQPDSRFRLLIDRETGTWFMADYQV